MKFVPGQMVRLEHIPGSAQLVRKRQLFMTSFYACKNAIYNEARSGVVTSEELLLVLQTVEDEARVLSSSGVLGWMDAANLEEVP